MVNVSGAKVRLKIPRRAIGADSNRNTYLGNMRYGHRRWTASCYIVIALVATEQK